MDNVVVTVCHREQEIDLDLPGELPISYLGPLLAEKLEWSDLLGHDEELIFSARVVNSGIVVRPSETLLNAGVADGDVLELVLVPRHSSENDKRSPTKPDMRPGTPYLQDTTTSQIFPCQLRTNKVGRSRACHINLGALSGGEAVSRVHANIVRRVDGFWIKDANSSNGTIVDGHMLPANGEVRIRNLSRIQFGVDGPVLVFHQPDVS